MEELQNLFRFIRVRENSGSLWKSGGESKHYSFNKKKCRLFSVKGAGQLHTGFGKTFRGNKLFILGYAWGKQKKENLLLQQLDNLNKNLLESNIIDIASLLGNRKKLLWTNLIAGISRGIGIGIGVTIITALLVMLLQKIVTLNIPVIGEYISDIVEIVENAH